MSKNQHGNAHNHRDVSSQVEATPFGNKSSGRLKAALRAGDTGHRPPAAADEVGHEEYEDYREYDDVELSEHHAEFSTGELPVTGSRAATASRFGEWALMFTGALMIAAGFALVVAVALSPSKIQPAIDTLNTMGITPGLMITLGVILALVSQLASRLQDLQHGIEEHLEWEYESNYQTTANLDFLVESQEEMDDRNAASDGDFNEVLLNLSRQDEQLNNLAKALRMYGKPLAEVSQQVAEVAALTRSTAADLGTFKKSVQADLGAATQKIADDMNSVRTHIPTDNSLALFVEEARAMGTRLTKEISQLVEAQGGNAESEGVASLRSDIDAMQAAVRGMTSELAHTSVPNQAPGSTSDQTSNPRPTADTEPRESGSLDQSIAGSRKSGGEDVLDAIARLKQMRP